ncbi:hypothetical protein [Crocosphaera chwakensis]|uniref:Uncharacterized protein n=1 Tax=Crocosphaera chwakensis CCY0110 TaxID=391612 RepID=A3IP93_9CHRO|nr:hypothetical protein [Crocosphaera chwakensis]EAZ91658.1 hypothetical protein CY0110_26043 [Crocosphaera chwakensis CCY0110]
MKLSVLSLLAVSTLSLIAVPAFADQANVQTSGQVSTQVGDNNTSSQRTTQSNLDSRRGRGENTGNAQDSYQDSLQEGNGNNSSQVTNQRNVVRNGRR